MESLLIGKLSVLYRLVSHLRAEWCFVALSTNNVIWDMLQRRMFHMPSLTSS